MSNSNPSGDQFEEPTQRDPLSAQLGEFKRSEKTKKTFMESLFGEHELQYKPMIEIQKVDSDEDDEEDISPVSPVKGKDISEDDRLEKVESLELRQKLIGRKVKQILEKIADFDHLDPAVLQKDVSQEGIQRLQTALDRLNKDSESLEVMKKGLINQRESKIQSIGDNQQVAHSLLSTNDNNGKARFSDSQPQTIHYNFEAKIKSSSRKLLMHKIQIKILELFRRINQQRVEELIKEAEDNANDHLDCDTYLFSSMFLEYLLFFLGYGLLLLFMSLVVMVFQTIVLLFIPCCILFRMSNPNRFRESFFSASKQFINLFSVLFQIIFILLFFQILFFPAILVVATQFFCISTLQLTSKSPDSETSLSLLLLKELMVIFFFFLSMKEISSAIDVIAYHYKRTTVKGSWLILYPIRMIPQFLQMIMTFWFCYINMYLIEEVSDPTTLIQNFAALAIVLEFDNYVMAFLRFMRFYTVYRKFLELFGHDEHIVRKINKEQMIKAIRDNEETMRDYEKILKEIKEEHKKTKNTNIDLEAARPEDIKVAKGKLEKIKRARPPLGQSVRITDEENSQGLMEFSKLMNSIVDKNIVKTAITFLGKQQSIEQMLSKEEFPIESEFSLNESEKGFWNWIAFFTVTIGIMTISLTFIYS